MPAALGVDLDHFYVLISWHYPLVLLGATFINIFDPRVECNLSDKIWVLGLLQCAGAG